MAVAQTESVSDDASDSGTASGLHMANGGFLSINAVTFATDDMQKSCKFYTALGLQKTYSTDEFSTFGSPGGPAGGDNTFHINLFAVNSTALPPRDDGSKNRYGRAGWNGWGRAIFYVEDVDAIYHRCLNNNLRPEAEPEDAPWEERYFQILDPMGHEITIAKPLGKRKPE